MPIKTLKTNGGSRLMKLGTIRKGSKKQKVDRGGKQIEIYGKDLDHFRFDCLSDKLQKALEGYQKGKPAVLTVQLPYSTPEENFINWFEDYSNNALKVRCDGEKINLYLDKDTKQYERPEDMPCKSQQGCTCKPIGRLNVILPLAIECGFIGFFEVQTHSINDIVAIQGYLEQIHSMAGDLRKITFEIYRYPAEISIRYVDKNKNAQRSRQEKHLVGIRVHPEVIKAIGGNFIPSQHLLKTINHNPVIETRDQIKRIEAMNDEF